MHSKNVLAVCLHNEELKWRCAYDNFCYIAVWNNTFVKRLINFSGVHSFSSHTRILSQILLLHSLFFVSRHFIFSFLCLNNFCLILLQFSFDFFLRSFVRFYSFILFIFLRLRAKTRHTKTKQRNIASGGGGRAKNWNSFEIICSNRIIWFCVDNMRVHWHETEAKDVQWYFSTPNKNSI